MEQLREEILQSERTRADLLKWKLALVGVIGAAGLGFSGDERLTNANLALCVIPFVCVYVDLLCWHLNLKMFVLGGFMRSKRTDSTDPTGRLIGEYEDWVQRARELTLKEAEGKEEANPEQDEKRQTGSSSAYALEDWALYGSTLALSLSLIAYAFTQSLHWPFIVSGAVGILASVSGELFYRRRRDALTRLMKM